jgi:Rieske Fe-S protein
MSQNRRQFLVNLWKAGGALLIGAAVYTGYEALRPLASNAGSGKLQLGDPKSFDTGTATYFPEGRLYVTNAKGDLFALSQKCPHLGCQVPFCESSGRFECPCHGSVFDVTSGVLVADTNTLDSGPDHGAKKYFSPPKGPTCVK